MTAGLYRILLSGEADDMSAVEVGIVGRGVALLCSDLPGGGRAYWIDGADLPKLATFRGRPCVVAVGTVYCLWRTGTAEALRADLGGAPWRVASTTPLRFSAAGATVGGTGSARSEREQP